MKTPGKIPSPLSRLKQLSFILVTAGLIFLVFNLLTIWVASRIFPVSSIFEPDRYRGIRLKSNLNQSFPIGTSKPWVWRKSGARFQVTTNAHGIRVSPPPPTAIPSPLPAFTVICLGDSHTFGGDVDDRLTYPAQLGDLLRTRLQIPNVQMINAGVPMYTTQQGLAYLGQELLRYHPQIVTLAFGIHDATQNTARIWCPLSNLSDADLIQPLSMQQWKPISLSLPERLESATLRLPLVSLFNLLLRTFSFHYHSWKFTATTNSRQIQEAVSAPRELSKCSGCRVPLSYFESNLIDFIELGRRHSFLPILIITCGTPMDYQQVEIEIAQRYRIPLVNVCDRLTHFQAEEISLRPELQELLRPYQQWLGPEALANNPKLLITTDGGHPNALGDRLIAEALVQAIDSWSKNKTP